MGGMNWSCVQWESRRLLNWLRESAPTTEGGRRFQSFMTRTENALRRFFLGYTSPVITQ